MGGRSRQRKGRGGGAISTYGHGEEGEEGELHVHVYVTQKTEDKSFASTASPLVDKRSSFNIVTRPRILVLLLSLASKIRTRSISS